MSRIVFLFGAGASYGAGGILPGRPPLGANLFSELSRIYPGSWGALPAPIRQAFTEGNFERGMGAVYENLGMAIPELMRDMAIFFVQYRPVERKSLYCRLVSDLQSMHAWSDITLSTLNYDCVLDFSVINRGLSVDYFDQEPEGSVSLWKLHGSCNFFVAGLEAGQGVKYGTGVTWEGGIQAFLDPERVIGHCLNETGLAPIMSLYMKGKPLNVSPTAVKTIQERWSERVLAAELVACIGARPWPEDNHLWSPLSETDARLVFIGDQQEFNLWNEEHRSGSGRHLSNTFAGGYVGLVEECEGI